MPGRGGYEPETGHRTGYLHSGLLQPPLSSTESKRSLETGYRFFGLERLRRVPIVSDGNTAYHSEITLKRAVDDTLDLKDAYFQIPIHPLHRPLLRFCHAGKVWQLTALPFGLSTAPRAFTKVMKAVLSYAHLHGVRLHMYLDDWLVNPNNQSSSLSDTQWLLGVCRTLGLLVNESKSDLVPSQECTYLGISLDTRAGLARPSSKRVTNWLSLVQDFLNNRDPQAIKWLRVLGHLVSLEKLVPYGRLRLRPLQTQLRRHWKQHRDPPQQRVPLDLLSRTALQWWTNMDNVRKGVPLGTVEIDWYLFSDSSTQGWGAHLRDMTAAGTWSPMLKALHINVLELHAVWLGLRSFSKVVDNTNVAIMCDNTSAIAYLKNQGGTRSQEMCDLSTRICLWAEARGITLVPRHIPGHLNVLADSLSRNGQILKAEWSLNQAVADEVFHLWGSPHVDLFALKMNTKLDTYMSPMPETEAWKVDSLIQSWAGLYAYAYPPTSLIRSCLNKIQSDKAELILIAPCWPNQEWFTDLMDLSIAIPRTLPQTRTLLKQTFSHQFNPDPSRLNLHAWRLSPCPIKREAFLKQCPSASLYHRESQPLNCTSLSGESLLNGASLSRLILAHPLSRR